MTPLLSHPRPRGFTMIELMVVVALVAIVLSLAAPSFKTFLMKKRVEGVTSELSADLQFARSEAVSRNAKVRISFDTYCYLITQQPDSSSPSSSCTQTTKTLGTGTTEIKLVQLASGSSASLSPDSSSFWLEFDPVRGIATFSTGATSGTVTVTSSDSASQLKATVSTVGRVQACSPTHMAGYASC